MVTVSWGKRMLKFIGWVIGIVLFCWATVSAFSIFSELKFLVDGWTWSVDQVPISIRAVALAVGKNVSGIVGGYREFVHGLVEMLRLPRLPQEAYDVLVLEVFSIKRGEWLQRRDALKEHERLALRRQKIETAISKNDYSEITKEEAEMYSARGQMRDDPSPLLLLQLSRWLYSKTSHLDTNLDRYRARLIVSFVYCGTVAIILAALFGIDFLYRHFA
jgi:hypothetical protein